MVKPECVLSITSPIYKNLIIDPRVLLPYSVPYIILPNTHD